MRNKKGFTLIELLVVISIIALLLSILMPSLQKAKEQARRIVCAANMKTIGYANEIYVGESDGWSIPNIAWVSPEMPYWFENELFREVIADSRKGRDIEIDPDTGGTIISYSLKEFRCPSDKRRDGIGIYDDGTSKIHIGIGLNMMGILNDETHGWTNYENNGIKRNKVIRPGQKLAFMDSVDMGLWADAADYNTFWDQYGDWCGPPNNWHAAAYRHNEGANITFYDGHYEYRKKAEVYKYGANVIETGKLNARLWYPAGEIYRTY